MNLKKLTTLLFAGVTAATPLVTSAQNPTILQGNYVSNVFGQANFVLNPNAQTNVANVTLSNATATRSTTTPLVATSEWNVTVTSSNGTAAWATRSFDAGMKNQNCEARFTYRGFQATSKAQIKQGANVVAELTLTPSATDPRIASINFPCGDLSAATTFVITDSATLSGVHEIGGIYVGLATNQANVAQAEAVVRATRSTSFSVPDASETIFPYTTEEFDIYSEYDSTTGVFTAKRAGKYLVTATMLWTINSIAAGEIRYIKLSLNGSSKLIAWEQQQASSNRYVTNQSTTTLNLNVGDSIDVRLFQNSGSAKDTHPDSSYNALSIYRFPSSSELVVTPENQNVWGGSRYYGSAIGANVRGGSVASTTFSTFNNSTWTANRTLQGKCSAPTTSANDVGCSIENLPVGSYKIQAHGLMYPVPGSSAYTVCSFELFETTTSTSIHNGTMFRESQNVGIAYETTSIGGIFKNDSNATRNFVLRAAKTNDTSAGNGGSCSIFAAATGGDISTFNIIVQPLDNASNSALYVQGPVKASATGAAIPAEYVGEKIEASTSSIFNASSTLNVWSNITGLTITLTPGVWEIDGIVGIMQSCYSSNAGFAFSNIAIMSGGSPIQRVAIGSFGDPANTSFYPVKCLTSGGTIRTIVNVTSSTSYQVGVQVGSWSGTPVFTNVVRSDVVPSFIRAVRIN